jgi:hypothetical protein
MATLFWATISQLPIMGLLLVMAYRWGLFY